MTRILIIGSTAHYALESSYKRAFESLGHAVEVWNPQAAVTRHARLGGLGRRMMSMVRVEPWERKANLDLLHLTTQFKPDILLVISTQGVRAGTLAQLKVELPGTRLYCIYPDSPHNLDTERIVCLPLFDRVAASSPAWVKPFKTLGARSATYLPFAADTDFFRPLEATPKHDLAFVGNWRVEREKFLEKLVDYDLRIWGEPYWRERTRRGSPLKERWGGRSLFGEELARACAEHRIMLNVYDVVTWPGPNMRTFEQPACRAFSLAARTPAVLELFAEAENIECFDSVEEARDKIKHYLANDSARSRIANASYRFVTEGGHTYRDRARHIVEWARIDADA